MGKQLQACFEEADRLGGLVARMRLASLAQIVSSEAGSAEDKPELVQRAQHALDTVRRQFVPAAKGLAPASEVVAAPSGEEQSRQLRRQLNTFLDLMSLRSLFLGDAQATMSHVTQAAATTLGVQRVSVWTVDPAVSKLTCADLYDQATGQHSSGVELFAKDFPAYFKALKVERTIAAHDAHTDPRTSCFSAPYLTPLGIGALLDVPIWVGKVMVGVVCHEHVGPKRAWNRDEETFAYLMSNFVALALERNGK